MKKIIIFDFDGVIADSLEIGLQCTINTFKKLGLNQIKTKKDYLECFEGNFFEKLIEKGVPKEKIPEIIQEFNREYLPKTKNILFFIEAIRILETLSQKHNLFIVSATGTKTIKKMLKEKTKLFKDIIGGDKETSKVKRIESIKKRFPNSEYFYIGDTQGDIIEGKIAKVKTIAVGWGWHTIEQLKKTKPNFIVNNPKELEELF